MVWNANYPLATTIVSASVDQIRDNWDAIEEWTDFEHVGFGSIATCGASSVGLHDPSKYGIVATSSVLSPSASGALAYNPDTGLFTIASSSLTRIPITTYWSQTRAVGGTHVLPTATWTILYFPVTSDYAFDTLGEWNTNYNIFTVKSTGYYLLMVKALFPFGASNYNKGLQILKNDVVTCQGYKFGKIHQVIQLYDVGVISASSTLKVRCYQNSGNDINLTSCAFYLIRLS